MLVVESEWVTPTTKKNRYSRQNNSHRRTINEGDAAERKHFGLNCVHFSEKLDNQNEELENVALLGEATPLSPSTWPKG
jgi:hypothetical protein